MQVIVIGAGIEGAATALALAREGHQVRVLERAALPATGASHANAGLVSPGHAFSWAEPGILGMALKSLLGWSDGIGICQPWSPALLKWSSLFIRQGTRERWLANSRASQALSSYSRDRQFADDGVLPLAAYGGRHAGILYLYDADHAPASDEATLLEEAGEVFMQLDADALLDHEPLLKGAAIRFGKGTYCPRDATGDAACFTQAALEEATRLGASIHFSETVLALDTDGTWITAVQTDKATYHPDAVVMAAGLASKALLAPCGYDLPIHAVTGYSLTYCGDFLSLPRVGAVSIPHKIAWASFGDHTVRFTGFADIGMPDKKRTEKRLQALKAFAAAILPEIRERQAVEWIGQRPMTPDNLPFLGASRHRNLWLNCGHGAMGWTMACGSAHVITDLIANRAPALDMTPYRWNRFR